MKILALILSLLPALAFAGAEDCEGQICFQYKGQTWVAPAGTLCFLPFEDSTGAASLTTDITGQVASTVIGAPSAGAVPAAMPAAAFQTGHGLSVGTATDYIYLSQAAKGGRNVPYTCSTLTDWDYYRTSNTSGAVTRYFFSVNKTGLDSVPWASKVRVAGTANDGATSITARAATSEGAATAPYMLLAGEWYHFTHVSQSTCSPIANAQATHYVYRYSTATWTKTNADQALSAFNDLVQFVSMPVGVGNVSGVYTAMLAGTMTNFMTRKAFFDPDVTPTLPVFTKVNYSFKIPKIFNFPLLAYR